MKVVTISSVTSFLLAWNKCKVSNMKGQSLNSIGNQNISPDVPSPLVSAHWSTQPWAHLNMFPLKFLKLGNYIMQAGFGLPDRRAPERYSAPSLASFWNENENRISYYWMGLGSKISIIGGNRRPPDFCRKVCERKSHLVIVQEKGEVLVANIHLQIWY